MQEQGQPDQARTSVIQRITKDVESAEANQPVGDNETNADLAKRWGVRLDKAELLSSKGDLINVIFDTALPMVQEGSTIDQVKQSFGEAIKTAGFAEGSKHFGEVMGIFDEAVASLDRPVKQNVGAEFKAALNEKRKTIEQPKVVTQAPHLDTLQ